MTIDSLGSPTSVRGSFTTGESNTASAPATGTRAPATPTVTVNPVTAKDAPASMDELQDAVGKLNASIPASSQGLEFSIDEDSKRTVVKLVDLTTKEVVRQYPSEEALRISKSLDGFKGMLVRHAV